MASAFPSPGPARLPVALIVWGALGIALNVGAARFTYGVMLPSLRSDLGLDYFAGGTLNAIHLAGYLLGTLFAPNLARGRGMAALSRGSHLLVAAGAVCCAAAPDSVAGFYVLALGRLATGLGAGGAIVAILVLIFAAIPVSSRPGVSAFVWAGMGAATVVSGLAVPWLLGTHVGWRVAFAVMALTALLLVVVFPPGPRDVSAPATASPMAGFPSRRIFTRSWIFLAASYLCFGVAYIAYATFVGAQLAAAHAPTAVVMTAWVAYGTATIAGTALAVPILRSPSLKRFALLAAAMNGAVGAAIATGTAAAAAFGAALLIGLGTASTPAIVSAYARDRTTLAEYPRAFGLVSSALGLGQLFGPALAGALADRFGTSAVPLFAAGAYVIAGLFAAMDAFSDKPKIDES